MPRFLLEVPHEDGVVACSRAVKLLLETGSHFLTHADFGCKDGDHRGWIIVETRTKDEARWMLPPALRATSRVVGLNRFSIDDLDDLLRKHGG
jgi:hypothetical protein